MSVKFDDFLQEQLQDPEFKKEYEALQPEHAIIQAIIDARQQSGLTQKELSERTGIAQGDISKLEEGMLIHLSAHCSVLPLVWE